MQLPHYVITPHQAGGFVIKVLCNVPSAHYPWQYRYISEAGPPVDLANHAKVFNSEKEAQTFLIKISPN